MISRGRVLICWPVRGTPPQNLRGLLPEQQQDQGNGGREHHPKNDSGNKTQAVAVVHADTNGSHASAVLRSDVAQCSK